MSDAYPEFFLIEQPPPGENIAAEEREIIKALGVTDVDLSFPCAIYNRRDDAEAVVTAFRRRKPSIILRVVGEREITP